MFKNLQLTKALHPNMGANFSLPQSLYKMHTLHQKLYHSSNPHFVRRCVLLSSFLFWFLLCNDYKVTKIFKIYFTTRQYKFLIKRTVISMVYLDKNQDIPTNSTFMKNVKFIVCTISFGYVSVN